MRVWGAGIAASNNTTVTLCKNRTRVNLLSPSTECVPPLSASPSSHSIHGFYCSEHNDTQVRCWKVLSTQQSCLSRATHLSRCSTIVANIGLSCCCTCPPSFLLPFHPNRMAAGCTPCALGRSASRRGRKEGGHHRFAPVLPSKGKCHTKTHASLLRLLL